MICRRSIVLRIYCKKCIRRKIRKRYIFVFSKYIFFVVGGDVVFWLFIYLFLDE